MTDTILLRYSPALGLVDAEGKPIGVVCVPKSGNNDIAQAADAYTWATEYKPKGFWWWERLYEAMLAAARPDLSQATVKVPERRTQTEDERYHPDAHYECGLTDGWNELLDATRARAEAARDVAGVTCPASRHVQQMAENLIKSGYDEIFNNEPDYAAESMLAVVADLWEKRAELAAAQARIESAVAAEANRWAERLNFVHLECGVDGSGTDSGDPLDVIESEIRQALEAARGGADTPSAAPHGSAT